METLGSGFTSYTCYLLASELASLGLCTLPPPPVCSLPLSPLHSSLLLSLAGSQVFQAGLKLTLK